MTLTSDLAEAVLAIAPASIPETALSASRRSLIDGLAVMQAALPFESAVEPFQQIARESGSGPSSLLSGGRTSPSMAALANGALSHALDFEDTFDPVGLHPNAVLIPALVALSEADDRTLGDFLAAMAIGCDITCRLGRALDGDPAQRGWYHPPIVSAVGATFGVAYLIGLNAEKTVSAISLTLAQFMLSDALKRSPSTDLRAIRDGFAARAVVDAVQLARCGVVGTSNPLGEQGGLFDILTGNPPDTTSLQQLGQNYLGEQVSIKLWPCCRGTHPAIQLALDMIAEGLSPLDIASVTFTVRPPDNMLFEPIADRHAPQTSIGAKFSIPYTFAHTLLHGAPGLNDFGRRARLNVQTATLAQKINLDGVTFDHPASATFVLNDASAFRRSLPAVTTCAINDIPLSDITSKVEACALVAGIEANRLLALLDAPANMKVSRILDTLTLRNLPAAP